MALNDSLGPIYAVLAEPLSAIDRTFTDAGNLWNLRTDNSKLREENEYLRRWQSIALALDSENARLKANLNWIPDPTANYVTARVVADAGGVYARAALLEVGPNHKRPDRVG
jgi:rod shape-determining protein MreC